MASNAAARILGLVELALRAEVRGDAGGALAAARRAEVIVLEALAAIDPAASEAAPHVFDLFERAAHALADVRRGRPGLAVARGLLAPLAFIASARHALRSSLRAA
jgi:hypothetical protein